MERTYAIQDIDKIAQDVIASCTSKTLFLNGEMGSGKTTLIKALAKALGSIDDVSSPTFSLVNEYLTPTEKIYHFDLYRIENTEELYDFGIEDYLYSEHWKFIEWPERLKEFNLEHTNILTIKVVENGARHLILKENNSITPNLPMYTQNIL